MSPQFYVNNKKISFFQKLRYIWFNDHYLQNNPYLIDNYREKYYYYIEEYPVYDIWFEHKGTTIGNIKLLWEENRLEVADIVIFPPSFKQKKNYRNRGLGTAMFSLVKQIAVDNEIKVIWGAMQPEDQASPEAWEKLRRFYRKQGCILDEKLFIYFVQK
ncbi:GNAT family N-acetyltransferase [bacterium]|nr:GNAT family N-acetyltransferase [bacterium]